MELCLTQAEDLKSSSPKVKAGQMMAQVVYNKPTLIRCLYGPNVFQGEPT